MLEDHDDSQVKTKEKEKLTAAWVVTVMLDWWEQTSSVSDFKT